MRDVRWAGRVESLESSLLIENLYIATLPRISRTRDANLANVLLDLNVLIQNVRLDPNVLRALLLIYGMYV